MAKQQFMFTLSAEQVREAVRNYAAGMIDATKYDLALTGTLPGAVNVVATKKRVRKAKVAAVKAAA